MGVECTRLSISMWVHRKQKCRTYKGAGRSGGNLELLGGIFLMGTDWNREPWIKEEVPLEDRGEPWLERERPSALRRREGIGGRWPAGHQDEMTAVAEDSSWGRATHGFPKYASPVGRRTHRKPWPGVFGVVPSKALLALFSHLCDSNYSPIFHSLDVTNKGNRST